MEDRSDSIHIQSSSLLAGTGDEIAVMSSDVKAFCPTKPSVDNFIEFVFTRTSRSRFTNH